MKKFLLLVIISLLIGSLPAQARPLNKSQMKQLDTQPTLRDQMDKMILSIADLDILVNRDKVTDYEIFKEDAERILKALTEMRKIDSTGLFAAYFNELEKPTKKLLEYSIKKDPRAMNYPEKIFNACFRCHQANRGY